MSDWKLIQFRMPSADVQRLDEELKFTKYATRAKFIKAMIQRYWDEPFFTSESGATARRASLRFRSHVGDTSDAN